MSVYNYNPYDRYRRRSARRMTSLMMSLVFLGIVFAFGFGIGKMYSQQSLYILGEEKRISGEERDKLQDDITLLRAESQTAKVRVEQLKASYEVLVSEGPMQDIVTLLRQQIEQGVDIKRLESVILSARPPQNCSKSEIRRFIVSTPSYNGPKSQVVIKKASIAISAKGTSAQSSKGKKEAWFDPGQPVEMSFQSGSEKPQIKRGVLPIYYSAVVGDKEYRFTVDAGSKSFVKVTYDHCDYP